MDVSHDMEIFQRGDDGREFGRAFRQRLRTKNQRGIVFRMVNKLRCRVFELEIQQVRTNLGH